MEEIEKLAREVLASGGRVACAETVEKIGQGDSPNGYEALRKIVLNDANSEDVREKALNCLIAVVSRAIGAWRAAGESEEEAEWVRGLAGGDARGRANAALSIMLYGSISTIGPIMDAMMVERDAEARIVMIEAGRTLLGRHGHELGPWASARAEKAIDAVAAFQRRAAELPLKRVMEDKPEKEVSGSNTVVLPKAKR